MKHEKHRSKQLGNIELSSRSCCSKRRNKNLLLPLLPTPYIRAMRRAALFTSRFAIGLLVAFVASLFFLLVFESPSLPDTPFAGIALDGGSKPLVNLPNRVFSCTEEDQLFRCKAVVQNRPLEITWIRSSDYKYNLLNCKAFYGGQAVGCTRFSSDYIGSKGLQYYFVIDGNLGLSDRQLQELRRKYFLTNFIPQISDDNWTKIATGASIVAASLTALSIWLPTAQELNNRQGLRMLVSISSSIVVFGLLWFVLQVSVLMLGFVD